MPLAAVVPDTPLLVPGVSGRTEVLAAARAAALAATRAVVAADPEHVIVLAPGPVERFGVAAPTCTSLAGLGIAEHQVGWPAPCDGQDCPEHHGPGDPDERASTGAAVALRLLAAAGWAGVNAVVEIDSAGGTAPDRPTNLRGFGASVASTGSAYLVAGSLGARSGEASPLAPDPRAGDVEALAYRVLTEPTTASLTEFADVSPAVAGELAMSGWGPWQALIGIVGAAQVRADVLAVEQAFGMTYPVVVWRWGT